MTADGRAEQGGETLKYQEINVISTSCIDNKEASLLCGILNVKPTWQNSKFTEHPHSCRQYVWNKYSKFKLRQSGYVCQCH